MASALEIVGAAASVATVAGILIVGWQLYLTKRLAVTQFEDQLATQYRDIARRLPLAALLGEALNDGAHAEALPDFYHYFDLSNEQAFLRKQGRITHGIWSNWREGIEQNLRRPAFARAWAEVSSRAPESFNDLRELVPVAAVTSRIVADSRDDLRAAARSPTSR